MDSVRAIDASLWRLAAEAKSSSTAAMRQVRGSRCFRTTRPAAPKERLPHQFRRSASPRRATRMVDATISSTSLAEIADATALLRSAPASHITTGCDDFSWSESDGGTTPTAGDLNLLERVDRPGRRPLIVVLRDDGTGRAFDDPNGTPDNSYVTITGGIISSGEFARWKAPEVAFYLGAMIAERYEVERQKRELGTGFTPTDPGAGKWFRPLTYIAFLAATTRAGAVRTLESLARIEEGAQGGALIECVTTTRTAKDGTVTTTVRERWTPPDWRADGWFLERRHPAEWSRRTELVVPDHEKAAEADPLVGVHDELRLARLARQKHLGA